MDKVEAMNRAREISSLKNQIKSLKSEINLLRNKNILLEEEVSNLQDENNKLEATKNDLMNRLDMKSPLKIPAQVEAEIRSRYSQPEEVDGFQETVQIKNVILRDLIAKESDPKNSCFTPETLEFANTIHTISPKCFEYIRKNIPFPTEYLCTMKDKQYEKDFPEDLININKMDSIIDNWKANQKIGKSNTLILL